jgi:hypothetical protein
MLIDKFLVFLCLFSPHLESHRSCESVLPLDSASKDVKKSSLLSDTLEEQEYMTETLQKMDENISLIADDMS